MDIILLKDIDTLGDKHEVISVKNGYGRNYLIPKGLAVIANTPNLKKLDDLIANEKAVEESKKDVYKALKEQVEGKTIKIGVKAGTSGKIFGSITSLQVSNALKEQLEIEVPRKKVDIGDEIKELGTYPAKIIFHPEVIGNISLELIKE